LREKVRPVGTSQSISPQVPVSSTLSILFEATAANDHEQGFASFNANRREQARPAYPQVDASFASRNAESLCSHKVVTEPVDASITYKEAPMLKTIKETCAILRCGRTAVYDLIKQGKLERVKPLKGKALITKASIDALIECSKM
jgi:excisionase family DNA binding protein